jgi:hypothetical protein
VHIYNSHHDSNYNSRCLFRGCMLKVQLSEILTFDRERSFDQAGERVEGASEAGDFWRMA